MSGLAYFGMVLGELIAFVVIFFDNPRYVKKLEANNNIPVPEWRLPIAMVGGILFSGKYQHCGMFLRRAMANTTV